MRKFSLLLALSLALALQAQDCQTPSAARTQSPVYPDSMVVQAGFYLMDLREIWEIEQLATVDFLVVLSWQDPRLSEDSLGYSLAGCNLSLLDVWNPGINVLWIDDLNPLWPERVRVDEHGNVNYSQRFSGEVGIDLDLKDFPFDQHNLSIALISLSGKTNPLKFVVDPTRVGQLPEISLPGWEIGEHQLVARDYFLPAINAQIPRLDFEIHLQREANFFLFKIFFPLSLIAFMAWIVFWIDPRQIMPQISLSSISILTLVAFQLSLRTLMPEISYLTRIDHFVIGTTLLVFAVLVEALVVIHLAEKGRYPLARRIDRIGRVVYVIAFLGLWVFAVLI